jgi:hypothetical protein
VDAKEWWLTQADIDQNLRDFKDQFAKAIPKNGAAPASALLNASYSDFQKHHHLHISLWALRRYPELVCLREQRHSFDSSRHGFFVC